MTNQTDMQIEIGKRFENIKGSPRQAFIKSGQKRLGSFLLWEDNPGDIRLTTFGKFWIHNLIEEGRES